MPTTRVAMEACGAVQCSAVRCSGAHCVRGYDISIKTFQVGRMGWNGMEWNGAIGNSGSNIMNGVGWPTGQDIDQYMSWGAVGCGAVLQHIVCLVTRSTFLLWGHSSSAAEHHTGAQRRTRLSPHFQHDFHFCYKQLACLQPQVFPTQACHHPPHSCHPTTTRPSCTLPVCGSSDPPPPPPPHRSSRYGPPLCPHTRRCG
mmetsp:Transcript_8199/g.13283  ORF Transcript_8199/g.13283 Transcript_8199/m.13283 type:complete len:200 (-) Transcript_8199:594-1193(-)